MFGKVQTWFPERGYGFIRPSENLKNLDSNLFFHQSELPLQYQRDGSKLKLGMAVEFGLGQRKGNTIAIEVRPLVDDSAPQTGAVHVGQ